MSNTSNFVRMNISLPQELVITLKENVSRGGISGFLAEAAREKMLAAEKEKALEELVAMPATFTKINNAQEYVRKIRSIDNKRMKTLGV